MDPVKEVKQTAAINLGDLLDAGDGAVVTLVAGDTRLVAHRSVLAARSPVFEAMFHHDTLESNSGHVTIPDVEGQVLRQLVAYCYTLQVPQLKDMAPQLLVAADKYGVSVLKAACEEQVIADLGTENAAAAAVLAVRHSCSSLRQAAINYVKACTHQVMATQGWAEAVLSQPKDVVEVSQLLAEQPAETRGVSAEEKGRRLLQAAEEGDAAELQALLSAGADLDARSDFQCTALHVAAFKGHVDAASRLLEAGAAVGARNRQQLTPLHAAAVNGHAAVVEVLLAASADPNARAVKGSTPLHLAAANGQADVAAALLRAGADRGARTDNGETPLDIARRKNKQQLIQILT